MGKIGDFDATGTEEVEMSVSKGDQGSIGFTINSEQWPGGAIWLTREQVEHMVDYLERLKDEDPWPSRTAWYEEKVVHQDGTINEDNWPPL